MIGLEHYLMVSGLLFALGLATEGVAAGAMAVLATGGAAGLELGAGLVTVESCDVFLA